MKFKYLSWHYTPWIVVNVCEKKYIVWGALCFMVFMLFMWGNHWIILSRIWKGNVAHIMMSLLDFFCWRVGISCRVCTAIWSGICWRRRMESLLASMVVQPSSRWDFKYPIRNFAAFLKVPSEKTVDLCQNLNIYCWKFY